MSGLRRSLAGLSEENRRALAHGLVLALEGRSIGKITSSDETGPTLRPFSRLPAENGASIPAECMAYFIRPDTEMGREFLLPRVDTAVPRNVPMDSTASRAGVFESTPAQDTGTRITARTDSKAVTLRREPAQVSEQLQELHDTEQRMREISRYFCQDSRRYDPGFTRY